MTTNKGAFFAALVIACLVICIGFASAQNTNSNNKPVNKSQDTIDRIREPNPPDVGKSTDTAKDRSEKENKAQKERDKQQKGLKIKEPPPPKNNNR
jgi:hypothetical protein